MDVRTQDGILLKGIPEGTPDEVIKERIRKIRAEKSDSPNFSQALTGEKGTMDQRLMDSMMPTGLDLSQYSGAAKESALSVPALMGAAGLIAGGPPGGLIGAGLGLLAEAPAMITGNKSWSPTETITQALRKYGLTPEPKEENRFGRKVASYVGGAIPTMGLGPAGKSMLYATEAGVGAATADHFFPDNPLAELAGAFAPGTANTAARYAKEIPSRVLARRSDLANVVKEPGRQGIIDKGDQLQKEFGGQLSASERGFGQGVLAAENEVAGYFPSAEANRRFSNETNIFSKLKPLFGSTTADEAAKALSEKSVSRIASLKSSRVPEFQKALDSASKIEDGGNTIDLSSVRNSIINEIKNIMKASVRGDTDNETIAYLNSQLSKLPSKSNNVDLQNIDISGLSGGPKANVEGVQSLLHQFTTEARASGGMLGEVKTAAQRRGAGFMKSAVTSALDSSAASGNKAAEILSNARSQYADVIGDISEIGSTPIGSLIEKATKKGGPITVKDMQSAWKRSSTEQREIIKKLIGDDKEIRRNMQGAYLDDLFERSSVITDEAGRGTLNSENSISLEKFLNNWKVDKNFLELFSDDNQRLNKILRGREYLSRIIERGSQKSSQGPVAGSASAGQQAVGMALSPGGQSKIFLGGNIARHLFPKVYRKLLTTDEGIEALKKVAYPGKYTPNEVVLATTMINSVLNDKEKESVDPDPGLLQYNPDWSP